MSTQKGRLFVFIVVVCSMFSQFATELYLPSMPAMAYYFKVQLSQVQLSITTYTLGYAIGSLFCGYFSDRIGRLAILFPSLLITVIGSLICCIVMSNNLLLLARIIQGLGLGGVGVVSRSIVRDVSSTKIEFAKFASILGSMSSLAIACAPIIGGYIERFLFWRINFILLLVMALILTWLCRYKLVETNKNTGKINLAFMAKDYLRIMRNQQFLLYNLISALTLAGFISYQTVSSFLLQVKVGLEPHEFGYTSLSVTLALVLGGILNSKLVERRGIDFMIKLGAILFFVGGLFYVIGGILNIINVEVILIPIIFFTIGAGIMYPNASSCALSLFTENAGSAASIYNCFQMLGATIGSYLISSIYLNSQTPLGIMFIVIGIGSLVTHYYLELVVLKDK